RRIQSVTETGARLVVGKVQAEIAQNRKRQVAETLEELEQREKARTKVTLRLRLERAGLEITPRSFWFASVGCGVLVGLGIFVMRARGMRRGGGSGHLRDGAQPADPGAGARGIRRHMGAAALDPGAPH